MNILLAVDGSDYSLAAVEEAARIPWPEGSVVKMISVAEIPMPTTPWMMPMSAGSYEEWEKIFEDRALANVTQALARFGEIAGTQLEVTTKTLRGEPKEALLDEAERWGADLLILGTHGYNTFERFWLGSVSRAITSHAKCTVHIARRRKEPDVTANTMKILLAVDGSECGNAAVEEIANRPWPRGTEVQVISIAHLPFAPTPETWALPDSYYSQMEKVGQEQTQAAINHALSCLRESNAARETPLILTGKTLVGHAEEIIIETAKDWGADLIVLGSHGYRAIERFLLGSVSQAVASHAPCSVEIVRKAPRQEAQ